MRLLYDNGEFTDAGGYLTLACIIAAILFGGWLVHEALEWRVTGVGTHTGYVTTVEKNGVLWPTWSVYIKTGINTSQEYRYCVRSDHESIIPIIQQASLTNMHVQITFETYYNVDWQDCLEHDAITGIQNTL